MTVRCVIPGSFDPIHLGHLDVVQRCASRFDEVVVAVLENPRKSGLFTVEERLALIEAQTADLPQVSTDRFQGLLVDYCTAHDIPIIAKGLRGVMDFEYELQMAQMNRHMSGVETMFLATSPEHGHLASSLVKEIATWGGPLEGLVPPAVATALRAKFA